MTQRPAPHPLERYLDAQDPVFDQVLEELRAGHKRTHWMWFIFPQIKGLGRSATADYFAIQSLDEAAAYADHPVLGPRLRLATELVNEAAAQAATQLPSSVRSRNTSPDSPIPCHSSGCRPEAERRDLP
jgi:uncharacterized protein (DUF1810 family)